MTALSDNQKCYAMRSYGIRATTQYLYLSFQCPSFLVAWTGCPEAVCLFSFLFSTGWGLPFLDFVVRGSHAQIAASFF